MLPILATKTQGLPPRGLVLGLLALPQATHHVLDGMLWRRKHTRRLPAQRGFPR